MTTYRITKAPRMLEAASIIRCAIGGGSMTLISMYLPLQGRRTPSEKLPGDWVLKGDVKDTETLALMLMEIRCEIEETA